MLRLISAVHGIYLGTGGTIDPGWQKVCVTFGGVVVVEMRGNFLASARETEDELQLSTL